MAAAPDTNDGLQLPEPLESAATPAASTHLPACLLPHARKLLEELALILRAHRRPSGPRHLRMHLASALREVDVAGQRRGPPSALVARLPAPEQLLGALLRLLPTDAPAEQPLCSHDSRPCLRPPRVPFKLRGSARRRHLRTMARARQRAARAGEALAEQLLPGSSDGGRHGMPRSSIEPLGTAEQPQPPSQLQPLCAGAFPGTPVPHGLIAAEVRAARRLLVLTREDVAPPRGEAGAAGEEQLLAQPSPLGALVTLHRLQLLADAQERVRAELHDTLQRQQRASDYAQLTMDIVARAAFRRGARCRVEMLAGAAKRSAALQAHAQRSADTSASLAAWHQNSAAAWQRRREEAAAARLAALRSASLPEYLCMLQEARNGRLRQVLAQTDACLRALAARIGAADLLAAPADQPPPADGDRSGNDSGDGGDGCGSVGERGCGVLGSSAAWARLAASLPADLDSQPAMLQGGQLRSYQMQGLRWLVGLSQRGLNGVLADEMGLGKTLQVIALICHCVESGTPLAGPFLIVCPASVLSSWAAELARWAPALRVVHYKGSAQERERVYTSQVSRRSFHVLLSTYELLMASQDKARLSRIKWACLVVDEAHRLKNAGCKLARDLHSYSSRSRLLITGTPLHNRLGELWALLNFLLPDVFNSEQDFDDWFGAPLAALKEAGAGAAARAGSAAEAALLSQEEYLLVTGRLHAVLRPFMLRRLKEAVAGELPSKREVVLRVPLGAYQAGLYGLVRTRLRSQALAGGGRSAADCGSGGGSGSGGGGGRGTRAARRDAAALRGVNNALMELRNICNHPLLSKLHPEYGEDLVAGGGGSCGSAALPPPTLRLASKVELLDQVLLRLAAGRHRVLLFCTMTRALDLLQDYCTWRGWSVLRLDGGTAGAERADAIARFNDPRSGVFLFLLSLRAGGVGLNLQAADTVIMFDSDWNPQIDLQAMTAYPIEGYRLLRETRLSVASRRTMHDRACAPAQAQARAHRIGQERDVLVVRLVAAGTVEEHVLRVAQEKRSFADSSITGGFFDGTTSAEARRQYLLGLLGEQPGGSADGSGGADGGGGLGRAGGVTAAGLDAALARGDAERATYAALSLQLPAPGARLAGTADCAALLEAARSAAAPRPSEDLSAYGRGMRGAARATAPALVLRPAAPAAGGSMAAAPPAEAQPSARNDGRASAGAAAAERAAASAAEGGAEEQRPAKLRAISGGSMHRRACSNAASAAVAGMSGPTSSRLAAGAGGPHGVSVGTPELPATGAADGPAAQQRACAPLPLPRAAVLSPTSAATAQPHASPVAQLTPAAEQALLEPAGQLCSQQLPRLLPAAPAPDPSGAAQAGARRGGGADGAGCASEAAGSAEAPVLQPAPTSECDCSLEGCDVPAMAQGDQDVALSGGGADPSGTSAAAVLPCSAEHVPVASGSARGYYSAVRDAVLPLLPRECHVHVAAGGTHVEASAGGAEQAQQQREWLSKPDFVRLGGRSRCHDANKAIHVLPGFGWPVVTLATHIKHGRARRRRNGTDSRHGGFDRERRPPGGACTEPGAVASAARQATSAASAGPRRPARAAREHA